MIPDFDKENEDKSQLKSDVIFEWLIRGMQFFGGLLFYLVYIYYLFINQLRRIEVSEEMMDKMEQVYNLVWFWVRDQVWIQVRDQVWIQVRNQVRDQVVDQVYGQIWDHLRNINLEVSND